MKRFNIFTCMICSFVLLFTSCSKDDPEVLAGEELKATVSFGAVLNDLVNRDGLKQATAVVPECSDGVPSYVGVVISGTSTVGAMGDPLLVDLISDAGEFFTVEAPELELVPGSYSLDFFGVYDAGGNLIWLAPTDDGEFTSYANSLPMEFNLGAGVKKYLDVDVLCFDNRVVNLYGYLFFDLQPNEAIEFCIFGNVCDDTGRHAPANFRFDVWTYSGNPADPYGAPLFDEENPYVNTVGVNNDGDAYADPLCFYLPDLAGEDVYYGELYIIENGTTTLIRSGEFTDEDVREMFDGVDNVDYYHFREGDCNLSDTPDLFGDTGGEGPTPVISSDTNIYIYFDSSGSMNSTLSPLQQMRNQLLRDVLITLYNNDDDLYDQKVRVISQGSERTFDFLNIQSDTPEGDVIVLVFQDEASGIYHNGAAWNANTTRTAAFDSDITTLRSRLSSFPVNYYHGVVFQVETAPDGEFNNFSNLITYVENGTGNYSGAYGLADRNEIDYVYNVTPGASPQYYQDLVVDALESLGYEL